MSPPDWVPDVVEDAASAAGDTLEAGYDTARDAAGDVRDGAVELAEDAYEQGSQLAQGAYEQGERLVQETGRAVEAGVDAAVDGAKAVGGVMLDTAIARWGPRLQGAGIAIDALASGVDRLVGLATQERLPLGVPAWMVRGAGPLPDVADDLRAAATALGELESALTGLLADTAGRLGWQGDAAEAAQARQVRQGTQLDQTAEALHAAAGAVDDLAGRLRADGPPLEELLDRYEQLRREALLEAALPTPLLLTARALDQGPGAAEQTRRIAEEEVPPLEGRLRDADAAARDALATAVATLRRVGAEASQDGWIGGATTSSVLGVLSRYDVVEDRTDRALVDWAATLGDDAASAAALRERLSALTPAQLADLLVRHPGMAEQLQGGLPGHPAPGSPEALLAAAMATSTGYSDRSAAVAAALAAMGPTASRRLALLYPEVVGRLDGASMADRVAANRVQISAALLAEHARTGDLTRALRDRGGVQEDLDDLLAGASIVLEDVDAAAALKRNAERIAYYESLLHEEVTPVRASADPGKVPHQIIYFDPRGDGSIAEVWGPLDEKTRNVGIFVPGTGADMESFAGYSAKAELLARRDRRGSTTMVAWLGSDMPDAVFANATRSHYSETAGERLRDFTDGLRLDADVDVTAVGHSYGGAVIGVADRMGLPVDRVVHVESAGAGAGVEDVGDYPPGRDVDRYTLQAPGDPISLTQGLQLGSVGHGADVNDMLGVIRLETGRFNDDDVFSDERDMVTGHSDPLVPGTTSWNNISGVIRGEAVTPYVPPTPVREHPYEDPTYHEPEVALESLTPDE